MAVEIERCPDGSIYKKIEYTNNKREVTDRIVKTYTLFTCCLNHLFQMVLIA